MMNAPHALNVKDIEITTLKLQNEKLQNDLKRKKEIYGKKAMIEEDKIILNNRLEKKSIELTKISNMKLGTLIQMMNANYELNVKDIEITTLKL